MERDIWQRIVLYSRISLSQTGQQHLHPVFINATSAPNTHLYWKGAICDFMKFSSLSPPKVVRFTNFNAATASQAENFINMTFRGCVTGSWSVYVYMIASLWKLASASTTGLPAMALVRLETNYQIINSMRSYDISHSHSMRHFVL